MLTFLLALSGIFQPLVGQATTMGQNGSIRFYGETTASTTEPTTTTSSSGTLPSTSGSGKLPQTGELVGASVTLSGLILLAVALLALKEKHKPEK